MSSAFSSSVGPAQESWDIANQAPGDIDTLITALEKKDVKIGVDQRLRLLFLIHNFVSVGVNRSHTHWWRQSLLAVLARTAEQRELIKPILDEWLLDRKQRHTSNDQTQNSSSPILALIKNVISVDNSALVLISSAVGLLIALYFASLLGLFSGLRVPIGASSAASSGPNVFGDVLLRFVVAVTTVVLGSLFLVWRRGAGARLLRGRDTAIDTATFEITEFDPPQWFQGPSATPSFDRLKRSRWFKTNRIDVRHSVASTIRSAGLPTLEMKLIREAPAYVLLTDRSGEADHASITTNAIFQALRRARIECARYDFGGRPNYLTRVSNTTSDPEVIPFSVVASRHSGERLIVIGDGAGFFRVPGIRRLRGGRHETVRPGTPHAELKHLNEFGTRLILTPNPIGDWRDNECFLSALGFSVLPNNLDGIDEIADLLTVSTDEVWQRMHTYSPGDGFIIHLRRQSTRYSSDVPPPNDEISQLVSDLVRWLEDRSLVVLLGAIAAFPEIKPEFTLLLGSGILSLANKKSAASPNNSAGTKLALSVDQYNRVMILPWLRESRMPDWLRIALLNELSKEELSDVRFLQFKILESLRWHNALGPDTLVDFRASLEVARPSTKELDELAARIDADQESPAAEKIFFATLHGERLDPQKDVINPEAPEAIRDRMTAPERQRERRYLLAIVGLAALTALTATEIAAVMSASATGVLNVLRQHPLIHPSNSVLSVGVVATSFAVFLSGALWFSAMSDLLVLRARRGLLLSLSRVLALIASVVLGGFAAYGTFGNYDFGYLLFGVAVGVALWTIFVTSNKWRRSSSADVAFASRIKGDDWIASTLGSAAIITLYWLPLQVTDPLRDWVPLVLLMGLGLPAASYLSRRWLFGETALQIDLLFVDAALGLLLSCSTLALGSAFLFVFSFGLFPPSWNGLPFFGTQLFLYCLNPLIVQARVRAAMGFSKGSPYTLAIASFSFLPLAFRLASPGIVAAFQGLVSPGLFAIWVYLLPMFFVWRRNVANAPEQVRVIVYRQFVLCLGSISIALLVMLLPAIRNVLPLEAQLISLSLIFWPVFRFAGPAAGLISLRDEAQLRPTWSDPRAVLLRLIDKPWWAAPALFAVTLTTTQRGYTWQALLTDIPSGLSALSIPIAVWFGSRHGQKSTAPVIVGALPLLMPRVVSGEPLAEMGGFWAFLVVQFWCRFASDAKLRARILNRKRLPSWEAATVVVLTAVSITVANLGVGGSLIIDPAWILITLSLIVGMSRMPRVTLISALVTAGAITFFLASITSDATPFGIQVRWSLIPAEIVTALCALFLPDTWRLLMASNGRPGRDMMFLFVPFIVIGIFVISDPVVANLDSRGMAIRIGPELLALLAFSGGFLGGKFSFPSISQMLSLASALSVVLVTLGWPFERTLLAAVFFAFGFLSFRLEERVLDDRLGASFLGKSINVGNAALP